jgi:iron complex outermembrane receptor protein
MSEITNTRENGPNLHLQLLATASAIVLSSLAYGSVALASDDADKPTLWIELGGQLSRLDDSQEAFAPVFPNSPSRPSIFSPSQKFEHLPLSSIDETGKLSFEPEGGDWVFSASVRYGRSTNNRDVSQQSHPKPFTVYGLGTVSGHPSIAKYVPPIANRFADTSVRNSESHAVLDFQAGKDMGLGIIGGRHGSSVVNLGVRFAQFTAKSNIALKSDPDWHFSYKYRYGVKLAPYQPYHTNQAHLQASRSFRGIGPSLSWNASAPLVDTAQDSELALDWGINAAALFGRQRAAVRHDAQAQSHPEHNESAGYRIVTYNPTPMNVIRSRTVIVPNVGGFAGLSFCYANAKVSAGYRADMFFHAMDGGIDARKSENVGFYGPFATVSVGLGG